jgi:SagB-type dehydrogenase family enzyme
VVELRLLREDPVERYRLLESPEYREVAVVLAKLPFLIVRTLLVDGLPVLRLDPLGAAAGPGEGPAVGTARLRLSRFALCRRQGKEFVLESPLSLYRAVLLAPGLAGLTAALVRPCSAEELVAGTTGGELTQSAVRLVAQELLAAGLLHTDQTEGQEPGFPDEADPTLRTWDFHDLLFHARSQAGRHDTPGGGTYRFFGELPPQPAVKPPMDGPVVPLPTPDLAEVAARDAPFTQVLESRESVRSYGLEGMTLDQLGELLYRTLRVRWVAETPPDYGRSYEVSSRPYPSGGAAYDLEVYLAATRCQGLGNGIYYYAPLSHELRQLHGEGPELTELRGWLRGTFDSEPDVLLMITSRFQRVSWKYESIAYSLVLRHVGVLYQTLYLVATSMGLAPCGIGLSDIALTERVLGLPFTEESVVGEFALGSRPAEETR